MERNRECLMIQSALRVSYTSPKVMHWITRLLVWLLKNESECAKLTSKAERIAAEAVAEGFFEKALEEMRAYDLRKYKSENYAFGVRTPHIVFNYLDYLLWKKAKKTHKDFVFEFRNLSSTGIHSILPMVLLMSGMEEMSSGICASSLEASTPSSPISRQHRRWIPIGVWCRRAA